MNSVYPSQNVTTFAAVTRVLLAIMLVVGAVAFVARVVPQPRTIDDAFITFRYSRNIVEGEGFVYNPGTRTLGTTTPFYTLLMAGMGGITGSDQYPWFALFVNALADGVSAALLAWLIYRVTGRYLVAAVLGLVWAFNPFSVTFAVGGMETSVGILWAVAATTLYVERRDRWMAVCAALAILTRVDTVLWVALLLLHQFITHWGATAAAGFPRDVRTLFVRVPWRSWAIFALILLPWVVFSFAYFGSPMSNSLSAKQVAYQVDAFQAFSRLLQHIATPFAEHHTFGPLGVMVGVVVYPALAGVGTFFVLRRVPRLLPYLIYPWVYMIVFSVMNPLMFRWYVAPITPAYLLAVLLGMWALFDALLARANRAAVLRVAYGVMGVFFVCLTLNAWHLKPTHGPDTPAPKMAWHKIEIEYRRVAETLRSEYGVTEDTLVAAGDIGAVGYYSRARILDTVGLVTPELSSYYPVPVEYLPENGTYRVPPDMILDYEPAYFVVMRGYILGGLEDHAAFQAQYAEIIRIPTDYYGDAMLVYQRRD